MAVAMSRETFYVHRNTVYAHRFIYIYMVRCHYHTHRKYCKVSFSWQHITAFFSLRIRYIIKMNLFFILLLIFYFAIRLATVRCTSLRRQVYIYIHS